MTASWRILEGDAAAVLATLPVKSAQTCVTSPPYYGLRDYGVAGQIGLEETPEEYVAKIVAVFAGVRRVLADDGTLWVNLGDSYAFGGCGARDAERWPKQSRNDHMLKHAKRTRSGGVKPKDLLGIPWSVAFALRADGWYLRSEIIYAKTNPMPESVTDRPTKSHEQIFLFAKSPKYFYDAGAVRVPISEKTKTTYGTARLSKGGGALVAADNWARDVPTRGPKLDEDGKVVDANLRDVWTVASAPYAGAHFATFPPKLIEPCILAGSRRGDLVLDPFSGSGTTGMVALRHGRRYVGIELSPEYAELSRRRITDDAPLFNRAAEGGA